MKIVELRAENVKRLAAVDITPEGAMVVVGGENAAGKSSVLDSIAYAIGGKGLLPDKPLRDGARTGQVVVRLGGDDTPPLVVTRTFTEKGSTLRVTAGGEKQSSPQSLLDNLCGKIAFDPLAFTREHPAKQADILRNLVGLDFTDLDAKRAELYERRTEVNRDVKALQARQTARGPVVDAPDEEVSVEDLVATLQRQRAVNSENADAKRELEAAEADVAKCKERFVAANARVTKTRGMPVYRPNEDVASTEKQIVESREINERVRANDERKQINSELITSEANADALTTRIESCNAGKQAKMRAATWPVEGLGFSGDGVTFNGLPFGQASSAERLRVAVAIGLALNPTLRVLLIRDGSLLDDNNLAVVARMADAANAQVWVERVGGGDECAVVIEDGRVKTDGAAASHLGGGVDGKKLET